MQRIDNEALLNLLQQQPPGAKIEIQFAGKDPVPLTVVSLRSEMTGEKRETVVTLRGR